ncbi:hypothetical protein ACJX0J_008209 [Zea mays]
MHILAFFFLITYFIFDHKMNAGIYVAVWQREKKIIHNKRNRAVRYKTWQLIEKY